MRERGVMDLKKISKEESLKAMKQESSRRGAINSTNRGDINDKKYGLDNQYQAILISLHDTVSEIKVNNFGKFDFD